MNTRKILSAILVTGTMLLSGAVFAQKAKTVTVGGAPM